MNVVLLSFISVPMVVLSLGLALGACQPKRKPDSELSQAATSKTPTLSKVDNVHAHSLVAQGATLLDVRTGPEYAEAHIKNAKNIPVDELGLRITELPKDIPIVIYCHSGRRSARAAQLLAEHGYEVHDLGPMSAWTE